MGSNYTPNPVGSGFQSEVNINAELEKIRLDLVDKVDREGVLPNAMNADFDMGTNRMLNVEEGVLGTDGVNLNQVINTATNIAQNVVNNSGSGGGNTTGDPITFNYFVAAGSQGLNNRTEFDLNTLTGGLVTEFNGLTVVINGVIQTPNAYTVTNDTLITLDESVENDTELMFIYGDLSPTPVFANVNATLDEVASVATAGQTVFTAPTYVIGLNQLMVHIDGVMQSLQFGDYTETSTTSVTLDVAMAGGERITIRNISGA